jgi:hypothetical protein
MSLTNYLFFSKNQTFLLFILHCLLIILLVWLVDAATRFDTPIIIIDLIIDHHLL